MVLRCGHPNLFLDILCQHTGLGTCSSIFCLENVGCACSLRRVSYTLDERGLLCDRRRRLTRILYLWFSLSCLCVRHWTQASWLYPSCKLWYRYYWAHDSFWNLYGLKDSCLGRGLVILNFITHKVGKLKLTLSFYLLDRLMCRMLWVYGAPWQFLSHFLEGQVSQENFALWLQELSGIQKQQRVTDLLLSGYRRR